MPTHGPTMSEGNLTPPPGSQGASRGASPVLPRAASPSPCPQGERDPLAQGNVPPSQGTGTSALGHGPPGSMGQSCPLAHENGHPHGSQGQGCPPAQGNGRFNNPGNENSEITVKTSETREYSEYDTEPNSEDNKAIYQAGNTTIVLNTILCFITTKKSWARLVLYDQIKKLYCPEEIENAYNIILSISDSRKTRNVNKDIKRMIHFIVHTMIDQCLKKDNLVFVTTTTDTPATDWSPPPKKAGISVPFVKIFQKPKHQAIQTQHELSYSNQDLIENKIDLLIGMFSEQQSAINSLIDQRVTSPQPQECGEEASVTTDSPPSPHATPGLPSPTHDQSAYQSFPFASPPPVRLSLTSTPNEHTHNHTPPTTPTPVPTTNTPPSSPPPPPSPSLPTPTPRTRDPADAPASPRPVPRKRLPNNAETSTAGTRNEASTQVTPRRSHGRNSRRKNKQKHLPPNRHWEDATHHHVPGVPTPPTTSTAPQAPQLVVNNYAERTQQQTNVQPQPDEEGFVQVSSRRQRRKAREERHPSKPLQGADRPQVVYLYITSCHPDTNEEDIEDFLENKFDIISNVKAFKTNMTHNYYSSFTVTIRGKDINPDLFLESDVFPDNVKVFLNRNKYKGEQDV